MTDFPRLKTSQLQTAARPHAWIWDGYIAPGMITLLTSMWKTGKSTLLAHLLAQRKSGGQLAERAVAPGATAVVSEEPDELWHDRNQQLVFGSNDSFYCRPFVNTPNQEVWERFLEHLQSLKPIDGTDLVIIDPISHFIPMHYENQAKLMLEALVPLRKLTSAGMAVVLVHHPRKATSVQGAASRGSGMLPSFVDILVEMYLMRPENPDDRRRRLLGFSRHRATPRVLLMELNADGSSYTKLDDKPDDEFHAQWTVLNMILQDASSEMTRVQIHENWPSDFMTPKVSTLWRYLDQAFDRGLIRRTGTGRKSDPYRYFLAEKMKEWLDDPLFRLAQASQTAMEAMKAKGYAGW